MTLAKSATLLAVALGLALTPPAIAQGKSGKKDGFCPPGLAKKNPPCIPPGQAKKYGIGDYVPEDDRDPFEDWRDGRLPEPPEGMGYYRFGDAILLLNHETGLIVSIFDAIAGGGN